MGENKEIILFCDKHKIKYEIDDGVVRVDIGAINDGEMASEFVEIITKHIKDE